MPWESYRKVMPRLARSYRVTAMEVRGHGRSQHTTGAYSFGRCAEDVVDLLRARGPALVTGNSSGGIIGMIAAARAPELVRGLLLEDPPLFSTDWPRLKDDTWVHGFFEHTLRTLPDLATYFATLQIPQQGKVKLMSFPRPLAWVLGRAIRRRRAKDPAGPIDIAWLPLHVRLFVRGLSEYDVDFTRACADGRMCDVDQGTVLAQVKCPATLMKAYSFRHPELGLVGAMDDDDVKRATQIKPDLEVIEYAKPHIIHIAAPGEWCDALDAVARKVSGPAPTAPPARA
jgi:pimeloyl-ACP methyl ester carboxylesterase